MWTVRTIYNWITSRGIEWRVFHDDSVFDAMIVAGPAGGVVLRLRYRDQLYDEQFFRTRAEAKRESAKTLGKLTALGWSEHRASSASAAGQPAAATARRIQSGYVVGVQRPCWTEKIDLDQASPSTRVATDAV